MDAWWGDGKVSGVELTRFGMKYFQMLDRTLKQLPRLLRPVSVEWAVGHECTIAYNRKGRRADGTTYLMREEDRRLLGRDFCGDVDTEAPLVCLRGKDGEPVCFLVQYTAHPATAFHPEHPNVFGEYAQVACERLSACYSNGHDVPVAFLQGCSGDINSKGLLSGDIAQATRYGERLAEVYIKASRKLRSSERNDFAFARAAVDVPLKHLPSQKHLLRQKTELLDFIRRAKEGDENTHSCIGLNFPKALTPLYRAALAQMPLEWTQWALKMHSAGKADSVPKAIKMEISALRIGDVGIVGLPCEPFIGIGRQIRRLSPLPLTIPCGYANICYGYVPDGPNVGDREYQSAFYLYTKFRPPYAKPGGDVLARTGGRLLKRLSRVVLPVQAV